MFNTKTLALIFVIIAVSADASNDKVRAFTRLLNYGPTYTNATLYYYYLLNAQRGPDQQGTFWAQDGGYDGMMGEDGQSPGTDFNYELYENLPQTMYDMATGEKRNPTPSMNGPQHNWYYMKENDPNSDTPWRSLKSAPNKLGKKAKKLFK